MFLPRDTSHSKPPNGINSLEVATQETGVGHGHRMNFCKRGAPFCFSEPCRCGLGDGGSGAVSDFPGTLCSELEGSDYPWSGESVFRDSAENAKRRRLHGGQPLESGERAAYPSKQEDKRTQDKLVERRATQRDERLRDFVKWRERKPANRPGVH